jgi:hypothetical protein
MSLLCPLDKSSQACNFCALVLIPLELVGVLDTVRLSGNTIAASLFIMFLLDSLEILRRLCWLSNRFGYEGDFF